MSINVENLFVVIVLYKEKLADSISFKSFGNINLKKCEVLIYDNSPQLDIDAKSNESVTYLHDPRNLGVSYAYNKGAELAKERGKNWLLLLDQDTELPFNFIGEIENQTKKYPSSSLYAMRLLNNQALFSPSGYRFKKGYLLKGMMPGLNRLDNITFLNSGLLLSTDLFSEAGGYDNSVPLYFSDFVFINRLRKIISTFVLLPINLNHSLSSNDETDIPSFKIRYQFFMDGAFQALKSEKNGYIAYYISTFLRAVKLSVKLKDTHYLSAYLAKIKSKSV